MSEKPHVFGTHRVYSQDDRELNVYSAETVRDLLQSLEAGFERRIVELLARRGAQFAADTVPQEVIRAQ